MVYALKNTDLKLNLEDPNSNIVEKNVYDKNGEFLGTYGMEIKIKWLECLYQVIKQNLAELQQ